MQRTVSPQTVTSGVRIMVPTLTAAALAIGSILIFQAPSRTSGPAFESLKLLIPIPQWGVGFLACGLVKLTGLLLRDRRVLVAGLSLGSFLFATWSVFLFVAVAKSPLASWTSPLYAAIVVVAHTGVIYSLGRDRILPASVVPPLPTHENL